MDTHEWPFPRLVFLICITIQLEYETIWGWNFKTTRELPHTHARLCSVNGQLINYEDILNSFKACSDLIPINPTEPYNVTWFLSLTVQGHESRLTWNQSCYIDYMQFLKFWVTPVGRCFTIWIKRGKTSLVLVSWDVVVSAVWYP